jgi:glutathione S-transferase
MKLYFSPGACSLSPHIVLREAGLAFDTEKVDLGSKQTASGADYRTINPKGSVPALQLDDGQVLTEGPVVVQYLADLVPEKQLAPALGSMERYRLMEWLNFISTELHKSYSPLFNPKTPDATKATVHELLAARYELVNSRLAQSDYLTGSQFTVADAYLFTVTRWSMYVNLDLARWPALQRFQERVAARPAVQAAMQAEGLIKS